MKEERKGRRRKNDQHFSIFFSKPSPFKIVAFLILFFLHIAYFRYKRERTTKIALAGTGTAFRGGVKIVHRKKKGKKRERKWV